MRRVPLAEAVLLLLTVAWGLSFVVIREAVRDGRNCGPLTLTALRMGVGLAALLALRPRALAATAFELRSGVLAGTMLAAGYVFQTAGMIEAPSGTSGFLTALYVPLVPLIAAAVARRCPPLRDLATLGVATAGIALLSLHEDLTLSVGEGLEVLGAFFWAAQIVVVGRVAERVDPVRIAAVQIATTLAIVAVARPFAPADVEPPLRWSGRLVGAVLFLGVVTNALGFFAQAWGQRRVPPTRTAILFSPEPVFAALFGAWFLDESFGARDWAGAALVMAAVVLAVWKPGRADDVAAPLPAPQ